MPDADPAHYVRGQYDGYREIAGVAADSRPRRTRRCGWRSTTGAGPGCRSSSAPASACRSRRPSSDSSSAARRGSASARRAAPGARPAHHPARPHDRHPHAGRGAARRGGRGRADLAGHGVRGRGRRGPDAVRGAPARRDGGDSTRFTRQDGVEETWRVLQPLLDAPPPVHPYAQGIVGPGRRRPLLAGHGRWHEPWVAS